jgi:hypothetical protein
MKHDFTAVEIMKMPENKAENADFKEQAGGGDRAVRGE